VRFPIWRFKRNYSVTELPMLNALTCEEKNEVLTLEDAGFIPCSVMLHNYGVGMVAINC
jgi:hypothetical protein